MRKIDLRGQRFGRLVVLEEAGRDKNGQVRWWCKCDCGRETIVLSSNLRSGSTISCGCYIRERTSERSTTHGMTKTRLYQTWLAILVTDGNP